ncbi:hypothetical protein B0H14DRAFT_3153303 [Mycena olivaceomarginata]|nr:hypothetical protein B0H14DRAFT_3153303 [Mycena olivaceomarginata]
MAIVYGLHGFQKGTQASSSSGQGTLCPSLDLPGANSALQLLGIKRKRRGAKLTLTRRWRHKSVTCPHCGTRISRKNDLARHIISVHEWREEAEVRKIVEEKERLWKIDRISIFGVSGVGIQSPRSAAEGGRPSSSAPDSRMHPSRRANLMDPLANASGVEIGAGVARPQREADKALRARNKAAEGLEQSTLAEEGNEELASVDRQLASAGRVRRG